MYPYKHALDLRGFRRRKAAASCSQRVQVKDSQATARQGRSMADEVRHPYCSYSMRQIQRVSACDTRHGGGVRTQNTSHALGAGCSWKRLTHSMSPQVEPRRRQLARSAKRGANLWEAASAGKGSTPAARGGVHNLDSEKRGVASSGRLHLRRGLAIVDQVTAEGG